jgi:hypothetical protein
MTKRLRAKAQNAYIGRRATKTDALGTTTIPRKLALAVKSNDRISSIDEPLFVTSVTGLLSSSEAGPSLGPSVLRLDIV